MMDGARLIMSLAVAGYLAWTALGNVRSGEIVTPSAKKLQRANDPGGFWFAIALSFAFAAFFLAVALGTIGKMAGWWEFRL